jgi:hypothetical protein
VSPVRIIGINAVGAQPAAAVGAPLRQNWRRNRVISSPGNKGHRAGLGPMRQTALGDQHLGIAIEQMQRQRLAHGEIVAAADVAVTLRVTCPWSADRTCLNEEA